MIPYFAIAATAIIFRAAWPRSTQDNFRRTLLFCRDVSVILGLALFAGLRFGIGTDFPSYLIHFNNLNPSGQWLQIVLNSGMDPGFTALGLVIKTMSSNASFYFTVLSLTTVSLAYKASQHGSRIPILSLWLYLSLGSYLDQLNVTRQSLAVAMCFYAAISRPTRRARVAILLMLAPMVHASAALFVLTYVGTRYFKRSPKATVFFVLALTSLFSVGLWRFNGFGYLSSVNRNYAGYIDSEWSGGSAYLILLALYLGVLCWIYLSGAWKDDLTSFAMLVGACVLLAVGTESIIVGRLANYYTIFAIVAIPNAVLRSKNKDLVTVATVLFGAVYMYMHLKYFGGLLPYQSFRNG